LDKAQEYELPFQRVKDLVYPERTRWKKDKNGNDIVGTYALRDGYHKAWWLYGEKRPGLYKAIEGMDRVLVVPKTTKYINPVLVDKCVFDQSLTVIALSTENDLVQILSSLHTEWVWKYSTTMRGVGIRYNATVLNYFPRIHDPIPLADELANKNKALRKLLCFSRDNGLNKIYNEFHDPGVTDPTVQNLRDNHVAIDQAVAKAYGWNDIKLGHDFHEMEYLPENDRVRFTICLEARKEVLKRLLLLNHERYEMENKGK
jgi:hypothetical protein